MSKVTKKQLQEDIKSLESGIAMNWSDMKKIETKISRAMTDMATRISNISLQLEGQQRQIHLAADSIGLNKQAIIMLENEREAEPEPQLKILDQSVFDGLDEKWQWAIIKHDGVAAILNARPTLDYTQWFLPLSLSVCSMGAGYDTSDWKNSLIERKAELKGSDLCRAMLERGDKYVMCLVFDDTRNLDVTYVIRGYHDGYFHTKRNSWENAIPINNQGEPLTAAEAGL